MGVVRTENACLQELVDFAHLAPVQCLDLKSKTVMVEYRRRDSPADMKVANQDGQSIE